MTAFFALVLTLGLSGCDADGGDPDKPVEPAVVIPNPGDTVVEIAAPGNTEEWKPPVDGYYLIELWGSQGWNPTDDTGNQYGGKGAYVRGIMEITPTEVAAGQTLYVSVGTGPLYPNEGYGGGASDVRWGEDTLFDRIIVAAGGGGSHDKSKGGTGSGSGFSKGGYGGAVQGGNGSDGIDNGRGGTQTAGGANGSSIEIAVTTQSAFGTGGTTAYNNESVGQGGNGYWGGGSGSHMDANGAGGGGSSFISGYAGCVAITGSGDTSAKTGTDEEKAVHYSGKVFVPSVTIGGTPYTTTMSAGNAEMPAPTSETGETETGHSGGGYARIVYLGKPST